MSEALDRLGRRLSDVARLHDHLEFRGVKLHAVNIGQVTTMHVGLLGTMAQLYLIRFEGEDAPWPTGPCARGQDPGRESLWLQVGGRPAR